MAPSRNVPLMAICLLLISGSICQPTTYQTGTLRSRSIPSEALELPSDDYYDETEDNPTTFPPETVSVNRGTLKRCDYNPCEEDQPPCAELRATNHCLCPGFTSHLEAPQAPFLKTVAWNGSDVILRWCAPYSFVKAYKVTVGGTERQRFGMDRRSGGLGPIENVSEVCVVSLNDAGDSEASCMMYQPRDHSLSLKAGLIGGALGLLLLLLLPVLLWRRRQRGKQQTAITMTDTIDT
ncbi:leucine-rich repeat neuronal protein 4 isoform X2 [Syngnathoides biaculeatus]|nr:leucine-rich repeat neuronal protein 4 isoform X2 [Syngnathoides biaculeatus]XP_061659697.1 leucine-rich repeat neuronal protein 4 isoform X2 [Syngnathoides biaculeatus]XP_061659699.1 leucine-rich repeat neuronal protein 4 isoform X2 [Syngnathoides biaculeatus]